MNDRASSKGLSLGLVELMAWVAGLAALSGLAVAVIRVSTRVPATVVIGGLIILYVVYIAFSVRAFWNMPRVAVPITLFIGGALWTLALLQIEKSDLTRTLITAIFIPVATVYAVRLISQDPGEPETIGGGPARPSLAHALLDRGMKFGNRPDRSRGPIDRDSEIRWVEPRAESLDRC
jgi:hypothetical protein